MAITARDLMTEDVRTVAPDLPLSDFQELMLKHEIRGAPVVEDGRLVGIISLSDIARQLAVEEQRIEDSSFYLEPYDAEDLTREDEQAAIRGAAQRLATLCVRDMMVPDVVAIGPEASVEDVARCMIDRHIHRVLVTADDGVVGLISSLDLVRLFADGRASA